MSDAMANTVYVIALVVGALVLLSSLVALVIGLRGRLRPTRAFCAACRHSLHDPMPTRCPECGADLEVQRAVAWATEQRRPGFALFGIAGIGLVIIAALFLPVALFGMVGTNPAMRESAALLQLEPSELATRIRDAEEGDPVWRGMGFAVLDPHFDRAHAVAAAAAAIEWQERALDGFTGGSVPIAGGVLFEEIVQTGLIADDELADMLDRAFGTPLCVVERIVEADRPLRVVLSRNHGLMDRTMSEIEPTPVIDRIEVGGVEVRFDVESVHHSIIATIPAGEIHAALAAGSGDETRFELRVVGGHRVEISTPAPIVARPVPTAPPSRTVRSGRISKVEVVEIIPQGEALGRAVHDDALRSAARAAIDIARVAFSVDLDPDRRVIEVELALTPIIGAAMSFDVAAEFTDEAGEAIAVPIGRVRQLQRGARPSPALPDSPTTMHLANWAPKIDANMSEVTLLFVPVEPFRHRGGPVGIFDHYIGDPLRFESLPIDRRDLVQLGGGEPDSASATSSEAEPEGDR